MISRGFRAFRFSALLACVASLPVAWAYIPPSGFVIKTMASKHGGVKGIRVRGLVSAIENEQPTSARIRITTVYHSGSATLRSWASDEANQKLYVFEKKLESGVEPLVLPIHSVGALLMDAQPARVIETLRKNGLPISQPIEPQNFSAKQESAKTDPAKADPSKPEPAKSEKAPEKMAFSRWNRTVAWVIGMSGSGASGDPQLWVEKDTFLPVRIVDASGRETVFDNYKHSREFPYPRLITRVDEKKTILKEEVSEVVVNPTKDLAEFKHAVHPGFTEAGNAASSELQDLIRKYYEVVN